MKTTIHTVKQKDTPENYIASMFVENIILHI